MKVLKYLAVMISILLITAFFIPQSSSINGEIDEEEMSERLHPSTGHPPIRIDNNADLAAEASSGNGTEADPYIIEGYEIDGGGYGYCIYIGNTTDHFVVRDCYLHNASGNDNYPYFVESGLHFYHVENGTSDNNTVSSNLEAGIYLSSSSSNTIANNTASNNRYGLLHRSSSSNNLIANNTASKNDLYGIRLYNENRNNLITNNTASNNYYGIDLSYSSNDNTIDKNTVSSNDEIGIRIYSASNNTLYHNNFINNTNQASDNGNNWWNASYPTGGNYWSDYDGVDNYSGPEQGQPGSDGIGDTNYSIGGGSNVDNYPLRVPTYLDTTYSLDLPVHPETDGWLFVSLPIVPYEDDVPLCLSDIQGSYDELMYFDSQDSEWKTYQTGRPSHYDDPIDVGPKEGFWIHMTAEDTLNIDGYIRNNHTITLQPGWNMVGHPSREDSPACDILPTNVTKVAYYLKYEPYNVKYTVYICSVKLVTGSGYWVYNNADHPVSYTVEY